MDNLFQKFPSIESFKSARKSALYLGIEKLRYKIHPKIHGTNGCVIIKDGQVYAQSRKRLLSLTSDNYGFAAFVEAHKDKFIEIFGEDDQYIYGEWCGKGIQDRVAMNSLSTRYFIAFKVLKNGQYKTPYYMPEEGLIRGVSEFGEEEYSVDLSSLTAAEEHYQEMLEKMLKIEERCPVAYKLEGVEGIGEGFVASIHGPQALSTLWFKVKGEKHTKGAKVAKQFTSVDVIAVGKAEDFMKEFFFDGRLEQGLDHLVEMNLEQSKKTTGAFLKWAKEEFTKEGLQMYVDAELDLSHWQKALTTHCVKWYHNVIQA